MGTPRGERDVNSVAQPTELQGGQGPKESLASSLEALGVERGEIEALFAAIAADGDRSANRSLGCAVASWIGSMITEIVGGTWEVPIDTTPARLTHLLNAYYGWQ